MKAVVLGVRFLLELCILASFAAWSAHLQIPLIEKAAVGAAVCVGGAIIWGLALSPRRRFDLPAPIRLVIEAGFFVAAAAALSDIGSWGLALALLVAAIGHRIALAVLR